MTYRPTIGLEVHAELKTATKMFCHSRNDSEEVRPNVNICPVCMAHPGVLPIINREAVRHILRVGVAAGGEIADFTEFDRKNYFYPDIPKGYQISQYKYPLVRGGSINGVLLTRVHLEEDTARSTHDEHEMSLVDFNRAGVPLMELVTEPVIASAAEAVAFAKELQLLLKALGASDANMERGEMRVEANVSVSASERLGTKVEIKNLNSFRAVERAIASEIDRHVTLLERGERVAQETRGWDEGKGVTFSQRKKEESHDYRYFPDPDLPALRLSEISGFSPAAIKQDLPELPWEKRERYVRSAHLKAEDANLFVSDAALGALFDDALTHLAGDTASIALAANYIANDIAALREKGSEGSLAHVTGKEVSDLVGLLASKAINSRNAKDIIAHLYRDGGHVVEISESRGLARDASIDIPELARSIVRKNPAAVEQYRKGKESSIQFLVGQGMKETVGAVDPIELREAIRSALS